MRPLSPIRLSADVSPDELLEQMAGGSFGARSLGHAWSVLRGVIADPDCKVLLTVSGALSVAQLGPIFAAMVKRDILHAVVCTGAVVTHQLVLELGMEQLHVPAGATDAALAAKRLHRVFDSIEPKANLDALGQFVRLTIGDASGALSSARIVRHLSSNLPVRTGWLAEAANQNVPVFVPALTDSELGLALHDYAGNSSRRFHFDPMLDIDEMLSWMRERTRIAIVTLGGGVPRNWAMQMIPYLRSRDASAIPHLCAGIRICPDSPAYGHLSGSTYSEAVTWGKLNADDLPNFAEVTCDATIAFPMLMLAAIRTVDNASGPPEPGGSGLRV